MLSLTEVPTAEEALELGRDGRADCYLAVEDGTSHVYFSPNAASRPSAEVVTAVLDRYLHGVAQYGLLAAEKPLALLLPSTAEAFFGDGVPVVELAVSHTVLDSMARYFYAVLAMKPLALLLPSTAEAFFGDGVPVVELPVTHTELDSMARYFYAVLAMAAGFSAMLGTTAVQRLQPTASALGARTTLAGTPRWRMLAPSLAAAWVCAFACLAAAFCYIRFVLDVGFGLGARTTLAGTPRWRMLAPSLAAAWVCAFACLAAAFCYIRFVLDVGFGSREGWCLVACAAASFMATAGGAAVGAYCKGGTAFGALTAVTLVLSLFAGLYGTAAPAQRPRSWPRPAARRWAPTARAARPSGRSRPSRWSSRYLRGSTARRPWTWPTPSPARYRGSRP